jgi:hypothetical protein
MQNNGIFLRYIIILINFMKLPLILILAVLFPQLTICQTTVNQKELFIQKANSTIKLDGILDEKDWLIAAKADNFKLVFPFDTAYAKNQTEVYTTFDDKNIYIGAKCFQKKKDYTISSLKRDFPPSSSDVFLVNIDTFSDKLNGFQFALSPLNVQREGLIVAGEEVSLFWDNKWYSEVKNYNDYWVVEVAIPFKSIRYKVTEGNTWGINFARNILATNEVSAWSPVPRNFRPANLAYAGKLIWQTPPPAQGPNISVIPYISAGGNVEIPRNDNDLKQLPERSDFTRGIGLDAKIAVTASLNLDLTINPDFSQVEVDRQQTNLNRFELFFPERRQFFLENSDLFGTFGFPESRPFFSRRIGIARSPIDGNNLPVKIIAGARLSGKLNNNLRIGLLSAQTQRINFDANNVLPTANYSVATIQQKVFSRSTISAIFANKSLSLNGLPESSANTKNKFNRVAGVEFNYFSANNRWEAETYFHKSFSPVQLNDATSMAHYTGYHHPNFDLNLGVLRIGENFKSDMGFVPRNGIYSVYIPAILKLNPKKASISKYINQYGVGLFESNFVYDLKGKLLDKVLNPYFHFSGPNGNEFYTGYSFLYTYLFDEFDPTNSELNANPNTRKNVVNLPIGGYNFGAFFIGYETSQRNNLYGEFGIDTGGFFNGKSTSINAEINYRFQPIGIVSLSVNYNDISLPKPYSQAKYWLVGPKAEIAFSKKVFFSNFFQFNTQTNNFNINSRLQWRFKPVSDLFLVYTDNRFATDIRDFGVNRFAPKNKALIFKMTYWLNV